MITQTSKIYFYIGPINVTGPALRQHSQRRQIETHKQMNEVREKGSVSSSMSHGWKTILG